MSAPQPLEVRAREDVLIFPSSTVVTIGASLLRMGGLE